MVEGLGECVASIDQGLAPREMVILAEDCETMVSRYRDVLGCRLTETFAGEYWYSDLETTSGIRTGIAPASEVGVKPSDRSANPVVLQVGVPAVRALFEHIEKAGGTPTFGPPFDEGGQFWYGDCADLEGNPIWGDESCP